jgi:hypothetical protein
VQKIDYTDVDDLQIAERFSPTLMIVHSSAYGFELYVRRTLTYGVMDNK